MQRSSLASLVQRALEGTSASWRQCWIVVTHTYRSTRPEAHVSVKTHELNLERQSSCSWLTAGVKASSEWQRVNHLEPPLGQSKSPAATNDWTSHPDRRHRRGGARLAVCGRPGCSSNERALFRWSCLHWRPLLADCSDSTGGQPAEFEAFDSEPWRVSGGISCIGPASVKGFASQGVDSFIIKDKAPSEQACVSPPLRQRSAQDQGRAGSAPSLAICAWLPVVSRLHPMLQRVRGHLRKRTSRLHPSRSLHNAKPPEASRHQIVAPTRFPRLPSACHLFSWPSRALALSLDLFTLFSALVQLCILYRPACLDTLSPT